jgi:hypothetical protein
MNQVDLCDSIAQICQSRTSGCRLLTSPCVLVFSTDNFVLLPIEYIIHYIYISQSAGHQMVWLLRYAREVEEG